MTPALSFYTIGVDAYARRIVGWQVSLDFLAPVGLRQEGPGILFSRGSGPTRPVAPSSSPGIFDIRDAVVPKR